MRGAMVCIVDAAFPLLGWGVLVTKREIVTAASAIFHPDQPIRITFPLLDARESVEARVRIHMPAVRNYPRQEFEGEDIAVLELIDDAPAGCHPISLLSAASARGHRFHALGRTIPLGDTWITGTIEGRRSSGWHQMRTGDHRFEGLDSFQGAPVWDEQLGGVIGVMVGSYPINDNICTMAPTELFQKIMPSLPIVRQAPATPPKRGNKPVSATAANSTKPKLFVASSREGKDLAGAVHHHLGGDAEVTAWDDGVFELTKDSLDSLLKVARNSDFGVFVFRPDDLTTSRRKQHMTTRDNILLELGIFLYALGRDRCFILRPQDTPKFKLPSDLLGIIVAEYESTRSDDNWKAATRVACDNIRVAIKNKGTRGAEG